MTRFVGKVAISSIFDGFVACLAAPRVLWVPESYPPHSPPKIRAGTPARKLSPPFQLLLTSQLQGQFYFIGCRLCRRPLKSDDWMISWILIGNGWFGLEMGGLVHPQFGLLCGAALPGAFFSQNNTPFKKKHYLL